MNLHFLLRLSLTLHIAGLSVALGTALACFVIAGKIRKAAAGEPPLVTTLFATISGLPSLMSIGMAVSIISGVAMMQLAYAAFMYELWFRLKIGVILLLFVNGIIAARSWPKAGSVQRKTTRAWVLSLKRCGRCTAFSSCFSC